MSETRGRIPEGSWLPTRMKRSRCGVGAIAQRDAEPEHPLTVQVEQQDLNVLRAARRWRQGNRRVTGTRGPLRKPQQQQRASECSFQLPSDGGWLLPSPGTGEKGTEGPRGARVGDSSESRACVSCAPAWQPLGRTRRPPPARGHPAGLRAGPQPAMGKNTKQTSNEKEILEKDGNPRSFSEVVLFAPFCSEPCTRCLVAVSAGLGQAIS